jgi:glycosyltransferase involved in cell wall biosynthesis
MKYIIRWAYKISAGNEYLAEYAGAYNKNVVILPTCVDMERQHNAVKSHHRGKPVVGWTGSHSTIEFMMPAVPMLKKLQEEFDFTFLVICNKKPDLDLRDWEFIEWNEKREVEDLLRLDIGIMPLVSNPWTRGKCGFKIIQYMSLGIPAVASPVGVNSRIIDHGKNGFICSTDAEWMEALRALIRDPSLRKDMGEEGRKKIIAQYSTQSRYAEFLGLFS